MAQNPPYVALSLCMALFVSGVSRAVAQETDTLNPMKAVAKEALKSFTERPLFDPTRRLAPVAAQQSKVAEEPILDEPPPLRLLGVIQGVHDMAVVQRQGETKTKVVQAGDYIDGWAVTVVPPVGVRLRRGDRSLDYELFGKSVVASSPHAIGPMASAPADAIGMPLVMRSDAWNIAPN